MTPQYFSSLRLPTCLHGFGNLAHGCQQEASGYFGSKQGCCVAGGSTNYLEGVINEQAFPRELLLDPQSSGQPKPHKWDLWKQGCGAQGRCHERQHNGHVQRRQGMELPQLTVWECQLSQLQKY
jgi:hypothetical protein